MPVYPFEEFGKFGLGQSKLRGGNKQLSAVIAVEGVQTGSNDDSPLHRTLHEASIALQ
jgi:hypothetical protein